MSDIKKLLTIDERLLLYQPLNDILRPVSWINLKPFNSYKSIIMSKILVIGDIMLDKYSYGLVKKLNPESPNPLVNIDYEEYKLWGAANVAANIACLKGTVELIGVLWKDDYGKKFESLCKQHNINLTSIVTWVPTITKQRFIETTYQQQLLRVDYEEKYSLSHANNEIIIALLEHIVPDYIIFSDYDKWIINKELVEGVKLYAKKHDIRIFVDIKPNNLKYFDDVYLIKPNLKEFRQMIGDDELQNTEVAIQKRWIEFVNQYKVNLVITRWSKWAILVTKEGQSYSLPTKAQQVFDVTGAGDTFLAAIVYALSQWNDLKYAVEFGNKASWIVVEKLGTATVTPEELRL